MADKKDEKANISRREFVIGGSAVVAGGVLGGVLGSQLFPTTEEVAAAVPLSEGYIVFDPKNVEVAGLAC